MPVTANTNTALTKVKRHFPAFNEMEDQNCLSVLRNVTIDPEISKTLLLRKKFSETPEDYKAALDAFRLPEGWGHFLRSLTDPVIAAISEGMSLTTIADIVGDPSLTLLLQIVRIYAFFLEGRSSSKKTLESGIVTRQEAQEIGQENEHLGALMSNAQELLDLLKLCEKRIITCVDQLLNIEW